MLATRLAACLMLALAPSVSAVASNAARDGHLRLQQQQQQQPIEDAHARYKNGDASPETTFDVIENVQQASNPSRYHGLVHLRFPTGSHAHGMGSGSNSAEEEQVSLHILDFG